MKRLVDAAQRATQDTARFMTMQLRHSALNNGWDSDVVDNIYVVHKDGKFSTHVHPDYSDRAFVHEFGDENRRPTAVMRKYANDPEISKQAFATSMSKHWGKTK